MPTANRNCWWSECSDGLDQSYWAKRQGNCIRGYISSVKAGKKYFYKVIYGGEEATLEINISGKKIQRGDLLGTRNVTVTKELKGIVDKWFNNYLVRRKIVQFDKTN